MAKAKVLDKSKHYGTILGPGARYEQDGILFDADGKEFKEPVVEVIEGAGGDTETLLQQAREEIKRLQDQLAETQDALLQAETDRDSLLSGDKQLNDTSDAPVNTTKTELDAQLEAQQGPL